MPDAINLSSLQQDPLPEPTAEQDLAMRRRLAGRRGFRPDNGPPTRTTAGAWMWRTTLDLPEAMQVELERLAAAQGTPEDQIVREALAAFGVGDASHVVGICDGTYSDDEVDADLNVTALFSRGSAAWQGIDW